MGNHTEERLEPPVAAYVLVGYSRKGVIALDRVVSKMR
jgi:hypothetical protein